MFLDTWSPEYKDCLSDLLKTEALALVENEELAGHLSFWLAMHGLSRNNYALAWELFQLALPEGVELSWHLSVLAENAPQAMQTRGSGKFLADLRPRVEAESDPVRRSRMMIDLANFMAFQDSAAAASYAYQAADILVATEDYDFWDSDFESFARLHGYLALPMIPQKYVDGVLRCWNERGSVVGKRYPGASLAESAVMVAPIHRETAARLLNSARDSVLLHKWTPQERSFGLAVLAHAARKVGVELATPSLKDAMGDLARLAETTVETAHLSSVLWDVVRDTPELALEVYPALRNESQRNHWFQCIFDASKDRCGAWENSCHPVGRSRLVPLARSRPKGYHRARSLAIATRCGG
ncbi:MAG: hypothetical protein HYU36_18120 [Planctomycetes bacterium]|nr:hypothetical protein [Planctomycetota bacterium]